MFAPEDQQIEICLLKSNLEEIENDLIVQRSALPELDAENDQKYRETMTALRIARSLNAESERLKLENDQLTAKRMQIKKQCEDLAQSIQNIRTYRNELVELYNQEEREMDQQIAKYEENLREKADRFRNTRRFYNESEMNGDIAQMNEMLSKLEAEKEERQDEVDELRHVLERLTTEIPDNLLEIVGKKEVEEKIKALNANYEALSNKRNHLKIRRNKFDRARIE